MLVWSHGLEQAESSGDDAASVSSNDTATSDKGVGENADLKNDIGDAGVRTLLQEVNYHVNMPSNISYQHALSNNLSTHTLNPPSQPIFTTPSPTHTPTHPHPPPPPPLLLPTGGEQQSAGASSGGVGKD